jgi:hypothetical protein
MLVCLWPFKEGFKRRRLAWSVLRRVARWVQLFTALNQACLQLSLLAAGAHLGRKASAPKAALLLQGF